MESVHSSRCVCVCVGGGGGNGVVGLGDATYCGFISIVLFICVAV